MPRFRARKAEVPIEKVLFLFIIVFNIFAIIFLYDFSSFIEIMIWADIILIAIIKTEKAVAAYIISKTLENQEKKKKSS